MASIILTAAGLRQLFFTGRHQRRRVSTVCPVVLTSWTESAAVNPWDGEMMNDLEINRGEDTVTFSANGEILETIPASELNYIDG